MESEKRMITLFLGAEGCQEVEGQSWIREATDEEAKAVVDAYEAEVRGKGIEPGDLLIDGINRPYWPMTLLPDAPEWARKAADRCYRKVRLE